MCFNKTVDVIQNEKTSKRQVQEEVPAVCNLQIDSDLTSANIHAALYRNKLDFPTRHYSW